MLRSLVALAVAASCAGSEDHHTLDSIPQAAAATVRREANGMQIQKVDRESEHGGEVFEATWFVDGVRHEAKVSAAGVLLEHEVEVREERVPAPVKAAAAKALAGGRALRFVMLMSGNFEAEAMFGDDEREVAIAPDGRVVGAKSERDDGDDGDDEDDD